MATGSHYKMKMLSLYGRVGYMENAIITLLTFWSFNISMCCKGWQQCLENEPKQTKTKCMAAKMFSFPLIQGRIYVKLIIKEEPDWKLSWNRKCENISICMLHLVILSIFTQKKYFLLQMCAPQGQPCWFTLNQWKTEKIRHVMCMIL